MDAGTLHNAIAEVCPVASAKVGKEDDRTTWSFDPGEGATQPQIDAGNSVIATIAVDAEPPPVAGEDVLLDHENRLLVIEGSPAITLAEFRKKKRAL